VIEDIKENKMKKLLAILMVLVLVSGALFAADPVVGSDDALAGSTQATVSSNSTLTIQANAPGLFVSGFSATKYDTFATIISKVGELGNLRRTVYFDNDEAQTLGYYLVATNTRKSFKIDLTATTLKSEAFIGGSFFHIPYDLIIDGVTGAVGTELGTEATYTKTLHNGLITGPLMEKAYTLDLLFGTLTDDVLIALPEGNYSATITVAITTNT
jgi:hypothetical protein